MQTTQLAHWQNGHQVRGGGWFHTYNLNIFSLGVMFSWGKKLSVQLFKLF